MCRLYVYDNSNIPRTDPPAQSDGVLGGVANAEIELYPILATIAPCIYPSLAIANKELYP